VTDLGSVENPAVAERRRDRLSAREKGGKGRMTLSSDGESPAENLASGPQAANEWGQSTQLPKARNGGDHSFLCEQHREKVKEDSIEGTGKR